METILALLQNTVEENLFDEAEEVHLQESLQRFATSFEAVSKDVFEVFHRFLQDEYNS